MNPPATIRDWILWIIAVAAAVGVLYVALSVFGVAIPGWVVTIFWICICAIIAAGAVKFIFSNAS